LIYVSANICAPLEKPKIFYKRLLKSVSYTQDAIHKKSEKYNSGGALLMATSF